MNYNRCGFTNYSRNYRHSEKNDIISGVNDVVFSILTKIIFFIGIIILVLFLLDTINILALRRKGKFVEFESKISCANKIISAFRNPDNSQDKRRSVGKCYKNINGKIYRIKYAICPFCRSEPIGHMYLTHLDKFNTYFWGCAENPSHIIEFDYKKIF